MYLPTRLPETETRADPFSLDALIAWLRTKNPEERYEWCLVGTPCLFGQYGIHLGLGDSETSAYAAVVRGFGYRSMGGTPIEPDSIACDYPRTFGAALSRATAIRGV